MKLYLTTDETKTVQGYNNIIVSNGSCKLDGIFKNSCDEIIVDNCLDCINNSLDFLKILSSLIRLNGVIKIYGIDLRNICLSYINGEFGLTEMRKLILDKHDIFSISDIFNVVKEVNLEVLKCELNGPSFDIQCLRKN